VDASGRGLEGSVALVSGAVRPPGIGTATLWRLASLGAALVCADDVTADRAGAGTDTAKVEAGALENLVDELRRAGHRAVACQLDALDGTSADAAVQAAVDEFGRLDLCCCLGGGTSSARDRPLLDLHEDDWRAALDLNVTSVWRLDRAAARQMIRQGGGGSIVNLGSFAAVRPANGAASFAVAKAGVAALTRALALELAPHQIRVNVVHPLGVQSANGVSAGLLRVAAAAGLPVDDWMRREIPFGRFQAPDETAAVVAFLCLPESAFVSGQEIAVSGAAQ
jgi:NAD(P)-dependent dehydrogenase (short-subunit alcohol dehydrogenase family)